MKISRLEIKNCLGIKELEVQAGKVNLITGDNETGKTSVLESIEKAIYNAERRAKFVRTGEQEATLFVEIDGLAIDRKIKDGSKGTVKVTQDGKPVKKPETCLKALVGEGGFAFNPIDFMQKDDKEQTRILLSLIPLEITENNLQEWFGEVPQVNLNQHPIEVLGYLAEKHYYDQRTVANAEVKDTQAEIGSLFEQLPDNYNGDDWRDINIGELWTQVQEAQRVNNNREKAQEYLNNYETNKQAIENKYHLQLQEVDKEITENISEAQEEIKKEKQKLKGEIEELRKKIEAKEQQIAVLDSQAKQVASNKRYEGEIQKENLEAKKAEELETLKSKAESARRYLEGKGAQDAEALKEKAEEAERMKGFVPLYDKYVSLQGQLKERQDRAKKLDDNVKLARELPMKLLQGAEMPVKGLGVDENMNITIDGLPIRNLSTSRQIKLALDIARATAGQMKLICIDRFESLSPENQQAFLEEIKDDDFQYFISSVTNGELKIETEG